MANKPRLLGDAKRVKHINKEPSKTKQSLSKQTNINEIVARYQKTGILEHTNDLRAVYADVSHITNYRDALDFVASAQQEFLDLPSNIRDRFQNDPGKLIEFLQNSQNQAEAIKMGMVKAPPHSEKLQQSTQTGPSEPQAPMAQEKPQVSPKEAPTSDSQPK